MPIAEQTPRAPATAAALIIGNELLSGKTGDSNLRPLAQLLRALGIELRQAVFVPDEVAAIAGHVSRLSGEFDVVFTSGGVGPTHDDVTLAALGLAFGVPLYVHPELERLLRAHYGESCCEVHLRMARVPVGAQLKTSAGVRWPTLVVGNVWVFPGVPELFRLRLTAVREHLRGPRVVHPISLLLPMEEPELTPQLDRVVALFPGVQIGSYPKWVHSGATTEVTFDAASGEEAESACAALLELLPPAVVVAATKTAG